MHSRPNLPYFLLRLLLEGLNRKTKAAHNNKNIQQYVSQDKSASAMEVSLRDARVRFDNVARVACLCTVAEMHPGVHSRNVF
jgi:hypothetical protein